MRKETQPPEQYYAAEILVYLPLKVRNHQGSVFCACRTKQHHFHVWGSPYLTDGTNFKIKIHTSVRQSDYGLPPSCPPHRPLQACPLRLAFGDVNENELLATKNCLHIELLSVNSRTGTRGGSCFCD